MIESDCPSAKKKVLDALGKGGGSKLAAALGVTRSAISQWPRIPADRVLEVERISGISRHELRPDIYPAPEAIAS